MNAPISLPDPLPESSEISFPSEFAELKGRLHRASSPRAAAVIHGATGVPQGYYRGFAEWLAGQGVSCLTYDYRDFARSAGPNSSRSTTTMVDWGLRDQQAAQEALEAAVPDVPIWVIGHSLGGLMLSFQSSAARVDRLIAVASGTVHFSDHPAKGKLFATAFWYSLGPFLVSVMGYLPGKLFGLPSDLPAGVYWQWRRWCTTRGFYFGDIGKVLPAPDMNVLQGKARFVAVADDWMVPPAAVWRLMQMYPNAWRTQKVLRPADYGLDKIGHIAPFARENSVIWPDIIADA